MAKRQKRSVSSTSTPIAASTSTERATVTGTPVTRSPVTRTPVTRTTSYIQEFKPDYTHILRDLKHIGIMVASFAAILVVLTFFLR